LEQDLRRESKLPEPKSDDSANDPQDAAEQETVYDPHRAAKGTCREGYRRIFVRTRLTVWYGYG